MTQQFYRAFEDRYRGSREVIKERLYKYNPFLQALHAHYPDAPAIDLGCGRGEWLEVLGEQGFSASGVDLDEGMLAVARERDLTVSKQDALAALVAVPDRSVAVVSAFHMVEHIPFDMVRTVATEALRVLVPGGLLILETPNPENIVVGSSDFYTDPSHLRPIPPNLLAFVTEHAGYARHIVVRLQENPQLNGDVPVDLLAVLSGASPDYSVVAQKAADASLLADFAPLFSASYGIDMKSLALRYQTRAAQEHAEIHHVLAGLAERISADRNASATEHQLISQRVDMLGSTQAEIAAGLADAVAQQQQSEASRQIADKNFSTRMDELELESAAIAPRLGLLEQQTIAARQAEIDRQTHLAERFDALEDLLVNAHKQEIDARSAELDRVRAESQQAVAALEARLTYAQQLTDIQAQRIAALLQSRSWRMTAFMRGFGSIVRLLNGTSPQARPAPSPMFSALLTNTAQVVRQHPRLQHVARAVLTRMPVLRTQLHTALHEQQAKAQPPRPQPGVEPDPVPGAELPVRTARIYRELKQALQAREKN